MRSEIRRRIKTLTGLFSLRSRNGKSAITVWTIFLAPKKLERRSGESGPFFHELEIKKAN